MSEVQQHISKSAPEITLSNSAKEHILAALGRPENSAYAGIRLSVKKTGCSGLSYVVDYLSSAEIEDLVQAKGFAQNIDNKFYLCIDHASYPFLKGSLIDYVREGFNAKFVFTNPNQKGQCGCGESFIVD